MIIPEKEQEVFDATGFLLKVERHMLHAHLSLPHTLCFLTDQFKCNLTLNSRLSFSPCTNNRIRYLNQVIVTVRQFSF